MQSTSSNKITIKLDKEITSLDFIRNYHPVVIRHALLNFTNIDLDTCLAYVSNKSVIRYLLLCGVNDAYALKDKFKRNLTTATPSSCKLEISKLKKALRKSKNILLSRGQKLAVGLNCRSFSDIRDLAEYGYENLKNYRKCVFSCFFFSMEHDYLYSYTHIYYHHDQYQPDQRYLQRVFRPQDD